MPREIPGLSARPCDNVGHSLNDSAYYSKKPRLWALTYVCMVAVQAVVISGFVLGFTSPVLSRLKDIQGGNKSLQRTTYQDIFNVRLVCSRLYCGYTYIHLTRDARP